MRVPFPESTQRHFFFFLEILPQLKNSYVFFVSTEKKWIEIIRTTREILDFTDFTLLSRVSESEINKQIDKQIDI